MSLQIKLFLIAFLTFILMDLIWFRLVASHFYFEHYAPFLRIVDGRAQFIWWAAVLIYIIFAVSLLVFVLPLAQNSLICAAGYGALLGGMFYAVYNLTCIAVFKDFPMYTAIVDISWGSLLYAWVAFLTQWLALQLKT